MKVTQLVPFSFTFLAYLLTIPTLCFLYIIISYHNHRAGFRYGQFQPSFLRNLICFPFDFDTRAVMFYFFISLFIASCYSCFLYSRWSFVKMLLWKLMKNNIIKINMGIVMNTVVKNRALFPQSGYIPNVIVNIW